MSSLLYNIKMVLTILFVGALVGAFIGLIAGVGSIVIQMLGGI